MRNVSTTSGLFASLPGLTAASGTCSPQAASTTGRRCTCGGQMSTSQRKPGAGGSGTGACQLACLLTQHRMPAARRSPFSFQHRCPYSAAGTRLSLSTSRPTGMPARRNDILRSSASRRSEAHFPASLPAPATPGCFSQPWRQRQGRRRRQAHFRHARGAPDAPAGLLSVSKGALGGLCLCPALL